MDELPWSWFLDHPLAYTTLRALHVCIFELMYEKDAHCSNFKVTVVAGASDMSFSFTDTFYNVGGSEYCTVIPQVAGQGQSAICTGVIGTSTAVNTITVSDISVQGIGAPAAAVVRRTGPSEVYLSEPTPAPNSGVAT